MPPGVDGAAADWSKAYFTEPTVLRRMNIHVRLTDRPNQRYALVFRDYLRSHLREMHRAIADGVPLDGYFLWSFIDNYEWEDGYQRRFGIVHCDFETQVRTPKLSARYYAHTIRTRCII